ncbi:MAG: hypothetical protein KGJ13_09595 [Patescibacteria group bacterium]|nr:hypothetical protein [Patescibacteria group bacterium]
MNKDELKNLLSIISAVVGGYLTQRGLASHEQVTQAASDISTIAPAIVSLCGIGYSIYSHWNMKKVPETHVMVAQVSNDQAEKFHIG